MARPKGFGITRSARGACRLTVEEKKLLEKLTSPKSKEVKPNTTLSCHHEVIYNPPPSLDDIVYCRRCTEYRTVVA